MKAGKSYVKDTSDFLEKLKNLGTIPSNAILVTADVVGLYPSIPHDAGLQALYEKLEERADKKISSTDLVEMAEFILKNKFLEQPLELSLLPHIRIYLWMEQKTSFLTQKSLSHGCG